MADAKPESVVEALNAIYRCVLTAFEQFHRQEHRFQVKYRYKVLVKRYDKLVHAARCWRRHILNRLEELGAEADSTLEPIAVEDAVKTAYEKTQALLEKIAAEIDKAVESAQVEKDHVTHKILLMQRKEVEHKIVKVRAWLNQVSDLKQSYLVTVVGS
jgi:DNA-binding ferritin-like protein